LSDAAQARADLEAAVGADLAALPGSGADVAR
jgi:hypothetical protein